jgi:hypothetical protein
MAQAATKPKRTELEKQIDRLKKIRHQLHVEREKYSQSDYSLHAGSALLSISYKALVEALEAMEIQAMIALRENRS